MGRVGSARSGFERAEVGREVGYKDGHEVGQEEGVDPAE